jgi:hypothetical protein
LIIKTFLPQEQVKWTKTVKLCCKRQGLRKLPIGVNTQETGSEHSSLSRSSFLVFAFPEFLSILKG